MSRLRFAVLLSLGLVGCTPSIGDKCILNTDCSLSGDRQCDTSQPQGYCTVFNCGPNSCPDNAACILFNKAVAGCPYDDRGASRTGHAFCMASCTSSSDCRAGYECADVKGPPWNALDQDTDQSKRVCVPTHDPSLGAFGSLPSVDAEAPVCQAAPPIDASFPPLDAGTPADAGPAEAGADGAGDAGVDAGADAGGQDAGADAGGRDAGARDAAVD